MTIAVIGASAGVGLETVKRALDRGHHVIALSRSAPDLGENNRLKIVMGSATNLSDLAIVVEGADTIIVALGTGTSMKATTLYSRFAEVLLEVHRKRRITVPVIAVTGFGAGDSGAFNSFLMKIFFRFFLKEVYADKTRMEATILASDLNWILVRPGLLKDKPLTEVYRTENTLFDGINIGSVNRADVADYLVKQAEHPTALKQFVSLSNR